MKKKLLLLTISIIAVSVYSQTYDYGFNKLTDAVKEGSHYYDPAYNNITFQIGSSNVHGEYIRAKACLGGMTGYILYGGIGMSRFFKAKNPDFIGPAPKKKMAWHAGLGIYGGSEEGEFALLMDYAETPLIENDMQKMFDEYRSYGEATNCKECRSCWAMNVCSYCAALRLDGGKWSNP